MTASPFLEPIARIRAFESRLLELFSAGELNGTTHTCIGQEICAVAVDGLLDPERDASFSNHRCHGHFMAYGGPVDGLMAEIMGRDGGVCEGRGGSQHLNWKHFYSTGIQGSGVPMAAGYALRMKQTGNGGIAVSHIGDGTLGEGVIYETMNMAALLGLPLLIVLEHNGWAQSTSTEKTISGDYLKRFEGFGVTVDRRKADDPDATVAHMREVIARVRGGQPHVQVLDTFRLMAHSKGDDNRPEELVQTGWATDWLHGQVESGAGADTWNAAQDEMQALSTELLTRPISNHPPGEALAPIPARGGFPDADGDKRINEALGAALDTLMGEHPQVMLIGEDLDDDYGGAFKVSRGLSTAHPEQVWSTPISEAGIVGLGNGMALNGGRPIVEIMFGDFVALAADQLINQAAKMHYMYAGQVSVPLTVRLVSGGFRGYGATHSQSLEGWLCGIPGLEVVALSRRHNAQALLSRVVMDDPNPVVFVENKMLYALRGLPGAPAGFTAIEESAGPYPPLHYSSGAADNIPAEITVVTYGGMTDMTEAAMNRLILDEETEFDYFILTRLSPLDIGPIAASVRQTGRLLVVEEGPSSYGVGAELIAALVADPDVPAFSAQRVGAAPVAIPSARTLEDRVLPDQGSITAALLDLLDG